MIKQRVLTAFAVVACTLAASLSDASGQEHRDKKIRRDLEQWRDDANWYYDDLENGLLAAKQENKPVMIVLRCIP